MIKRTGYGTIDDGLIERKERTIAPLAVSEQETVIHYMRDQEFATIYTSDSTQMTRFDKLCESSPDMYSLIADTGRGKTYKCADKNLVSLRKKKREMSDEQKEAASERFKELHAEGKIGKGRKKKNESEM